MYSAEVWPRVPRRAASRRATAGTPGHRARASRDIAAQAAPAQIDELRDGEHEANGGARTPGQTAPTRTISRRVRTPASAACHAPAAPPSAAAAKTISDPAPSCATIRSEGSSSCEQAAHEHEQRQQRRCDTGAGRSHHGQDTR